MENFKIRLEFQGKFIVNPFYMSYSLIYVQACNYDYS